MRTRPVLLPLLLLPLLLLVVGCASDGEPKFTEPADFSGRQCVAVCDDERRLCLADIAPDLTACEDRYWGEYNRWKQCMRRRPSQCGPAPTECSAERIAPRCGGAYERCMLGCGARLAE